MRMVRCLKFELLWTHNKIISQLVFIAKMFTLKDNRKSNKEDNDTNRSSYACCRYGKVKTISDVVATML